jgi:tellurite resistance protein TehA-like permease
MNRASVPSWFAPLVGLMVSSVPGINSSILGSVISVVGAVVGAVVGMVVGAVVGAVVGRVEGAVGALVSAGFVLRQPASMVTVRTSTSAILQIFFM